VAAGRVRVIAQTSARRSAHVRDVPTVAESGYPGFEADVWIAVMAPARTPPEAIARLHDELARAIRDPAMRESLWDRQAMEPRGGPPEEVTALMRAESDKWRRLAREARLDME
jgi:tripartite-type tricarboxylate transporter receptor subunit TctC